LIIAYLKLETNYLISQLLNFLFFKNNFSRSFVDSLINNDIDLKVLMKNFFSMDFLKIKIKFHSHKFLSRITILNNHLHYNNS